MTQNLKQIVSFSMKFAQENTITVLITQPIQADCTLTKRT